MKRQFKILSLFVVMMAAITACQPNQNKVRGSVGTNNPNNSGVLSTTLSTTCSGQSTGSVLGAITGTNATTFQNSIVALLNATMTADQVGTVSPFLGDSTGIRFKGTVALDASGNVVSANSYVKISIYDSIWLSNQSESNSIPLEFNPANGASITGAFNLTTGAGSFTLKDNYGQIRFDGTLVAGGNFSGTVSFSNTASVSGSAQSGTLGQFTISTCGIIQK